MDDIFKFDGFGHNQFHRGHFKQFQRGEILMAFEWLLDVDSVAEPYSNLIGKRQQEEYVEGERGDGYDSCNGNVFNIRIERVVCKA